MNFNLYVDESCHMQYDKIPIMCLGYIKVPEMGYERLKNHFVNLKLKHKAPEEIKWNKFSKGRLEFYKALVDCFFEHPLEFRSVLVKFKERLNHDDYNQGSHDNFYYKMVFYLLKPNGPTGKYKVFLDIKDTRGKEKLLKVEEVFNNAYHGNSPFYHFQHIRSHENVFIQLADLFIGAITFKTRLEAKNVDENKFKLEFINYLESKSGFSLHEGTPVWESKFNIFDIQPKRGIN